MDAPAKRVLVVDDESSIRTLVAKALTAKKYLVEEATNGLQAAERLGHAERLPDLLICDVNMPLVDGFSFARLIKADAGLRGIPIIFLTARSAAEDITLGIRLGARHYIRKPFTLDDLFDKVRKVIR